MSASMQSTAAPPPQAPAVHVSPVVHRLPSSQAVPSAMTELVQTPVAGTQTPSVWHESGVAQTTGLPPIQTPPEHVSV